MPKEQSRYYIYGRMAAIIEQAALRAGLAPNTALIKKEQCLRTPKVYLVKYIALYVSKDDLMSNRMASAVKTLSPDDPWPSHLSLEQLAEATLATYHERHAIQRNYQITRIRKKLGLTQQEFADKLNVSRSAVQHWDYHRRDCPETVLAVAKTFLDQKDVKAIEQEEAEQAAEAVE